MFLKRVIRNLPQLTDVQLSAPADGQALTYEGGIWTSRPVAAVEHDHDDRYYTRLDVNQLVEAVELTPGPAGSSAYDVWIAQGNVGTEADFLNAIIGPQGEPGPKGDPGDPASNIITSVNSQTGAVVLSAADVGAAPAAHLHGVGDVTGLSAALGDLLPAATFDSFADHVAETYRPIAESFRTFRGITDTDALLFLPASRGDQAIVTPDLPTEPHQRWELAGDATEMDGNDYTAMGQPGGWPSRFVINCPSAWPGPEQIEVAWYAPWGWYVGWDDTDTYRAVYIPSDGGTISFYVATDDSSATFKYPIGAFPPPYEADAGVEEFNPWSHDGVSIESGIVTVAAASNPANWRRLVVADGDGNLSGVFIPWRDTSANLNGTAGYAGMLASNSQVPGELRLYDGILQGGHKIVRCFAYSAIGVADAPIRAGEILVDEVTGGDTEVYISTPHYSGVHQWTAIFSMHEMSGDVSATLSDATIANTLQAGTAIAGSLVCNGSAILNGGLSVTAGEISGNGAGLTGIPQSAVTNLTTALAGKAASSHTHGQGDVTGLTAALAGKASLSGANTFAGNQTIDGTFVVRSPTAKSMMRVDTFGDANNRYFWNLDGGATLVIGRDGFFGAAVLSRLDLCADQIFLAGTNLNVSAHAVMARMGDATSTANQFGSRGVWFQGSRWSGIAAQIVTQAKMATFASASVNGGIRLNALIRNTDNTADIQIMDIHNTDGGRVEFHVPIEATSATAGVILRAPNGTRYRVTVDNSGNLTTAAA